VAKSSTQKYKEMVESFKLRTSNNVKHELYDIGFRRTDSTGVNYGDIVTYKNEKTGQIIKVPTGSLESSVYDYTKGQTDAIKAFLLKNQKGAELDISNMP